MIQLSKKIIIGIVMKFLYAPWRSRYVSKNQPSLQDIRPCVFCQKLEQKDDAGNYILTRREHAAIFMNLYPYNTAHLLIIPHKHHATLDAYSAEERTAFIELINESITKIEQVFKPHGFNVGMNIKAAAGAGIPEHLHIHVLPRWEGDTNFMPIIAGTKQISYDMLECYQKLKEVF